MNLNNQDKIDITQLIGKLKNADSNYSKLCKRFKIVYWIFIPLYTVIAFVDYFDTKEINELIAGLCFVAAFVIFAFIFGKYQKEYNAVDYSLPTLTMLKQAASRYHPFRRKSIFLIPIVLLFDIHFILKNPSDFKTIQTQIIFFSVVILSMAIGLVVWYFKYKPLRDNALAIISELEES